MVRLRLCDAPQPAVMTIAVVGHASDRVAATCSDADVVLKRTGTVWDGEGPQPRRPVITFIPLALTLVNRVSNAVKAYRLRQAEREIARVLTLFGGRGISPETKQRLVTDYMAGRPFAIHASELW